MDINYAKMKMQTFGSDTVMQCISAELEAKGTGSLAVVCDGDA
jgi:hypothetical protein